MSFPAHKKSILSEWRKFNWIKKSIFKFRQNSKFRKPDNLKKNHYQIIGDLISEQRNTFNEKKSDQVKHFFFNKNDLILLQIINNKFLYFV